MRASTATVARSSAGIVWKAGLMAGCVAAAANVLLYGVAKGVGVTFLVHMGTDGQAQAIPLGMVIAASVVGALAGAVVRLAFLRSKDHGARRFQIVSVLLLLASFGGPLGAGADAATKATLVIMHIIAGVSVIRFLSRGVSSSRELS